MKALIPIMLPMLLSACAGASAPVPAKSPAARLASAEIAGQVRRCYRSPRVPSVGRRIVTRLLVRYGPDGRVVGLPTLVWQQGVTEESKPYAGRMIEAARLAVIRCNPIRFPSALSKGRAREFYLTFSPRMMA